MQRVVIIGTGGTIAGVAARPHDHVGYDAAVLGIDDLLAELPALQRQALESETLARLDSCDMDHATWVALARRAAWHMARADVAGVVVTHGTDTLEETAYFLHRTLRADKPLVLTAAMRPATAPSADGPQNLLDAVALARLPGARGVLAVLAGRVHAGVDLRKLHGYRVDAFSSGDAGAVAAIENGSVRVFRAWPASEPHAADALSIDPARWPVVDIVTSHAGARGAVIDALVTAGAAGIVVAGTGNGSLHADLRQAAWRALAARVRVVRASRCLLGGVVDTLAQGPPGGVAGAPVSAPVSPPTSAPDGGLPSAGPLTPVQARIELLLDLLADPTRPR